MRPLPLKVFQVEPFCAAAEPSESSSRSRAEPRTEQARLLLPIADGHLHDHRRRRRQQLQKLKLQERPAPGEKGEEDKGGRAMRVRRPRWIFKTKRKTKKWEDGGWRCDAAAELCPVCEEEEKVASGSGEPGKGEGGQRIVCELLLLPSRPAHPGAPCHLRFSDEAIKRFAFMIAHLIIIRLRGVALCHWCCGRADEKPRRSRHMVAARRVACLRIWCQTGQRKWTRGTHPLCSALFSARPAMRSAMDDDAVGPEPGPGASQAPIPVLARTSAQPHGNPRTRPGHSDSELKMVAVVALNGAVTLALPAYSTCLSHRQPPHMEVAPPRCERGKICPSFQCALPPAPQQDENGSSTPAFTIFS
nr:unnamed protein product [Digitaria exilis]